MDSLTSGISDVRVTMREGAVKNSKRVAVEAITLSAGKSVQVLARYGPVGKNSRQCQRRSGLSLDELGPQRARWRARCQGLRSFLIRRRFNEYAVTALCAAVHCVTVALAHGAGVGSARSSVGLISSVLFLIPGFPLVTALLDGVMIVPGLYALETLVYFDRGEILKGLSAAGLVGFVVGSIAFGLAAARFISQPEWLRE